MAHTPPAMQTKTTLEWNTEGTWQPPTQGVPDWLHEPLWRRSSYRSLTNLLHQVHASRKQLSL